MSLFDVLNLIGGLSLFLFGMHVMGAALEKRADGRRAEKSRGQQAGSDLISVDRKAPQGLFARYGGDGGHPVVVCNDSHGRWLCQLGAYDPQAGHPRHHGRKRRHNGHGVVTQLSRP